MAETYSCKVVTPDGIAFEDDVVLAIVDGSGGDLGVMANHAPIVTDLEMGSVQLELADESWKKYATLEGFVQVQGSKAIVLVEEAIAYDDITEEMATEIIASGEDEIQRAETQAKDDPYTADVEKAHKAKAWGEHLLELAGTPG